MAAVRPRRQTHLQSVTHVIISQLTRELCHAEWCLLGFIFAISSDSSRNQAVSRLTAAQALTDLKSTVSTGRLHERSYRHQTGQPEEAEA